MNIAQETETAPCLTCNGTGRVPFVDRSIANGHPSPCPSCRGSKRRLVCSGQVSAPKSALSDGYYNGSESPAPKLRLASYE